jgi:glycine cleavage system regulatory protein
MPQWGRIPDQSCRLERAMTPIILTLIGHDRPGLVNAVSEKVTAFGGSWLESRLARLAGEFAGIVLVDVPDANVDSLTAALKDLEAIGLQVSVKQGAREDTTAAHKHLKLDLVGHDRPGIVREIAHALTQRRINIEEFGSWLATASFSGEKLFHVTADLRVPDSVTIDDLRSLLERLANEMMVDITIAEQQ